MTKRRFTSSSPPDNNEAKKLRFLFSPYFLAGGGPGMRDQSMTAKESSSDPKAVGGDLSLMYNYLRHRVRFIRLQRMPFCE